MSIKVLTHNSFIGWELASKDTIDVKKIYIDVADDVIAGMLLSQIVYWNLPDKQGRTRLRVKKGEHLWLAKRHEDWKDEIRLTARQVRYALDRLKAKNIVTVKLYKFNGAPTTHIRINWDIFLEKLNIELGVIVPNTDDSKEFGIEQNVKMEFDKMCDSNLTKCKNGIEQNVKMEFDKMCDSITETTNRDYLTETTSEIEKTVLGNPPYDLEKRGEAEKPTDISFYQSASDSTNRPAGLELPKILSKSVIDFIYGLDMGPHVPDCEREQQFLTFTETLISNYDETLLLRTIDSILKKVYSGEIIKYNPAYVLKALEIEARIIAQEDEMQKVYTKFEEWCLKFFRDKDLANEVIYFYKKVLSTDYIKSGKYGIKDKNVTQRRIQNIEKIIEDVGEAQFFKMLRRFTEKSKTGTLTANNMNYFTAAVYNDFKKKSSETAAVDTPAPEESVVREVIPEPIARVRDIYAVEFEKSNWDFRCKCREIVGTWDGNCPKCNAFLMWNSVPIPTKPDERDENNERNECSMR